MNTWMNLWLQFVRLRVYFCVGLRVLLCVHLRSHMCIGLRVRVRTAHFPLALYAWGFLKITIYDLLESANGKPTRLYARPLIKGEFSYFFAYLKIYARLRKFLGGTLGKVAEISKPAIYRKVIGENHREITGVHVGRFPSKKHYG